MNMHSQDQASQGQWEQIENLITQITRFNEQGAKTDLLSSHRAPASVLNFNYKSLFDSEKAPQIQRQHFFK
jgi:hypothetical protein